MDRNHMLNQSMRMMIIFKFKYLILNLILKVLYYLILWLKLRISFQLLMKYFLNLIFKDLHFKLKLNLKLYKLNQQRHHLLL